LRSQVLIFVALFAITFTALPNFAAAQSASSRVTYVVGFATVKPSIDGLWEPNEWNDANELQLTQKPSSAGANQTCDGGVYLRMKHDDSSLYGIIDAVTDFGASWTVGNQTYEGSATFLFNGDNDGMFQSNDMSDYIVGFSPGVTGASLVSKSFSNFSSQIVAGISAWSSPHSSNLHRIYTFSIPIQPLIKYAPLQSGEPVIGFELIVVYSSIGVCDLMGSSTLPAELIFSSIPVPENVGLIMPLALVLAVILLSNPKIRVRSTKPIRKRSS